jgi:hypothetical protein
MVSLPGSGTTFRFFGAALTLKLVDAKNASADNGPTPRGPTTPTANMYVSHASKSVIVALKLFVFCLGPAHNIAEIINFT